MEKEGKNFLTKHIDTIIILTAVCSSVLWMNGKFNDIHTQFTGIEKDIAVLKAVLIMQKIMPAELAINGE